MARGLSAQFLGPQHAIDIIPHTAIVAYGKEYFFGQGIQSMRPHEFRASRGIRPIELRLLGRTNRTEQEFEDWCGAQATNGNFGAQSYDLLTRNCNNFSDEAARNGLRLPQGVPQWILEVPQKFLRSPMGMIVRPMLEQMQITGNAPTNLSTGAARTSMAPTTFSPSIPPTSTNPWADVPSAASTTATEVTSPAKPIAHATPLLDKQTALLSTDTGVVKVCVDRLKPEEEQTRELLLKLADTKASWTQQEIDSVHQYLRLIIDNAPQHVTFALMLLRLIVMKQSSSASMSSNKEQTQSTQLVATLLLRGELKTLPTISMAWCVLSNAIGATPLPKWSVFVGTDGDKLARVIDRALSDSDPSREGASTPAHMSLRQSAAAFLYNLAIDNGTNDDAVGSESAELSEGIMSVLLGCLEHLQSENDATTCKRHLMSVGQLLKSRKFGGTAIKLVKDLGLVDESFGKGKGRDVEDLAKEVVVLLQCN